MNGLVFGTSGSDVLPTCEPAGVEKRFCAVVLQAYHGNKSGLEAVEKTVINRSVR